MENAYIYAKPGLMVILITEATTVNLTTIWLAADVAFILALFNLLYGSSVAFLLFQ